MESNPATQPSPTQDARQHEGAQRRIRVSCELCGREFDRKDSLLRHAKVHDKKRQLLKPRRKACLQCSRGKTRCSNETPSCSACLKRSLQCVYEGQGQMSGPSKTPNYESLMSMNSDASGLNDAAPQRDTELGRLAPSTSGHNGQQPSTTEDVINVQFPSSPQGSERFIGNVSEQDDFSMFDYQDLDFSTGLNWIFEPANSNWAASPQDFPMGSQSAGTDSALIPLQADLHPLASEPVRHPVSEDNAKRVVPNWAEGDLPSPKPQDVPSPEDPWSADNNTGPAQRLVLPPLVREEEPFLAQRYFSTRALDASEWTALKRCIELPSRQPLWQAVDVHAFPDRETIDHCIDLYFAHVHQMSPIIHRPTFDPSDNLVVTLAIVTLGACYSNWEGARAFADSLSELTRRLLLYMAEQNRSFVRTEQYLTVQLMQGLHGYLSGNQRLFELSESCRSSLIHHARCMGLLRDEVPEKRLADSLEASWHSWIRQERLRRLGWAVYEYDICIAFLHNSQPYLNMAECNLALPSSMEPWDAETAYAWATAYPCSSTAPPKQRLSPLIKLLTENEATVDKLTNERHRLIVIMALGRMLWSVKETRLPTMASLTGENLEQIQDRIAYTLERLKRFPIPLSQHQSRKAVARAVHQTQLVHLIRLYCAGDLMDIFSNFLRKVLLRQTIAGAGAKTRLRQWATASPKRIRGVAYHCAQILALARKFPENLALEPFHIFQAGVLLVVLVRLMQTAQPEHNQNTALHIDYLGTPGDETYIKIAAWLETGEPPNVGMHGVPVLCCRPGWTQMLDQVAELLSGIKAWGISETLLRVVIKIRDETLDVSWWD